MAFTGDPVDAHTALAWGLVSRVVAPEKLRDAALELAGRIAANPPDVRPATLRHRPGCRPALQRLRALHTGHVGDYVTWLLAGVVTLGAALAASSH